MDSARRARLLAGFEEYERRRRERLRRAHRIDRLRRGGASWAAVSREVGLSIGTCRKELNALKDGEI